VKKGALSAVADPLTIGYNLPMRILFLYPVPAENRKVYTGYSQGIGLLSACLKEAGHETWLLFLQGLWEASLDRALAEFRPQLIALSSTTDQFAMARRAISYLERSAHPPIILGGIHASFARQEELELPGIWGVCRGEGEKVLLELVRRLERNENPLGTPGFWFRGQPEFNPAAGLADLDALPFPDRELFDYQKLIDRHPRIIGAEFLASRGCPYECSYCANPALKRLQGNEGPFLRFRGVGKLIEEIQKVVRTYRNVRLIGFHDDIFGLDRDWLESFSDAYPRGVGLPFWCNGRVDLMDEERVNLLKKAGCLRVHLGVEAGNDEIRKKVLKRNIEKDTIREAFARLKRAGIRAAAFNMIGLPFETVETIEETIALNREIKPDWVFHSVFHPYPGTELYELCQAKGWISGHWAESFYDPETPLDQPSISRESVAKYYREFVRRVYE